MSKKLFLLPALLGAILMFTPACNQDDCKDVDCGANGACFSGACVCDDGYEEDAEGKCNTEWRSKFLGIYNVAEVCGGSPSGNFSSSVTVSSQDVTKVIISNFGDSGVAVTCDITGPDRISVPTTTVQGLSISGSGTISGNTLTISYSSSSFNCTMTMTKQ
ncbi:MAG: hypothetical protein ACK4NS_06400 [Saprospiraceae bacterium]